MTFKHTLPALIALSFAFAGPAVAGDKWHLLETAAKDVSKASGAPLKVEPAKPSQFIWVEGERLRISPDTLAFVENDKEAKALVALALAYRGRTVGKFVDRSDSALNAVGAVGHTVLDSRTHGGLPDAREIPNHTREEQRAYEAKLGAKRAALAVQIANQSGSCAAPIVNVLKRMRSATLPEASGFARQAMRDLGKSIYPPDSSCISG